MIYLDRRGWKVSARPDIFTNSHEILISVQGLDGKEKLYVPKFVKEHSEATIIPSDAIINVSKDFLQAFLECAWGLGLRPAGYENVHEALKAKQEHIEDLRNFSTSMLRIAEKQS